MRAWLQVRRGALRERKRGGDVDIQYLGSGFRRRV